MIAKFPNKGDEANTVLWEGVALTLAADAGIPVPAWRIAAVAMWRKVAAKLSLISAEIDRMASAFEHEDLRAALRLAAENRPQSY
jgi:hypothetical protein